MIEQVRRGVAAAGRAVAWLTLALVLVTFAVVLLRYGFNLGWIWLQESITYLHATVFMLAAAWALQDDAHVRVDVFYRRRSPRQQAFVNLAGTVLFLIPLCTFLLVTGWEYVLRSWQVLEGSREAGGLPLVYLLKTLILLLPALLLAQSACEIGRAVTVLRAERTGDGSR
jgi:TRAP-type mannitol/chloroaromatic compound transport system permease small subunit